MKYFRARMSYFRPAEVPCVSVIELRSELFQQQLSFYWQILPEVITNWREPASWIEN